MAEIDLPQRAGDVGLGARLDRKAQHRNEIAQRLQAPLAKTVGMPGLPARIDAVHLAHRAGLAESVYEGQEMLMALGGHLVGHRKIVVVEIAEIEAQFLEAVFEHVEEGRAPPTLRCLADCGRTVLEYFALVALLVVPAKAAALKDWGAACR